MFGIYGLIAYSVTQRTREIGIHVALGSTSSGVARLILRQALTLTGLGIVAGCLASLGLTRYIAACCMAFAQTDPATFAAVAAILLLVTLGASWIPVPRAFASGSHDCPEKGVGAANVP